MTKVRNNSGDGRRVAIGVILFLAIQYGAGLWRLVNRSTGMESKFSRLASSDYLGFLIGQNLLVLIAYAILGLAAWLLVMPPATWLCGRFEALRGGWRQVAVALVLCLLGHGYFMFRLVHARPYFMGDAEFGDWYYRVLELPPESWRRWTDALAFDVLPWLALAAVAAWWWIRLGSRIRLAAGTLLVAGLLVMFWKPGHAAVPATGGAEKPMNIVVIGSDSLRGDRLGYSGYRPERTDGAAEAGVSPAIDEWARSAAVFENCRTPIGSTLESHFSMMSSSYPHTHGLRQMFVSREEVEVAERKVVTLADLLSEKGYDTAAIGDWCAGFYEMTDLGFEETDVSSFDNFQIYMSQAVFLAHFVVPLYFDNEAGYRIFPQIRSFAQFVTPEVVTQRVEERAVEQAASGRPFFWHVFYSCNHLPYRSSEPYCRMFGDPEYRGRNATGVDFDIDQFIGGTDLEDKWAALPENEARQIRALYDGCTRQFDDCFRRIIEALEKNGLAENTIVVITADHGDDLYETGVTLGHGLGFNGSDPSYHVPLAIHVPGRGMERFDEQVRTIDLAPTLAQLTGVEIPDTWEGRSLVPWIDDPEAAMDLPYFGETQFPFIQFHVPGVERPELPPMDGLTYIDPDFNDQFVLRPEFREPVVTAKQRCLRTRDWKIVCTPTREGTRHFGLFHTASDPDCQKDLAAARPEILQPMRTALERWIDRMEETQIETIFPGGEPAS